MKHIAGLEILIYFNMISKAYAKIFQVEKPLIHL